MKDSIVQSVLEKYERRASLGFIKYKTNLDREDLDIVDWIDHAQDEAMDLTLYLEKLKKYIIEKNL